MIEPWVARVVLAVYSALLLVGGVMGYVKAKSRPSLVAGVVSGLVGFGAVALAGSSRGGLYLGAALTGAMSVLFGGRYFTTRKFMPSGMLALASMVVEAVVSYTVVRR